MSFIREPNAEPIQGYRLIEPLGNGGFGEVWKCEAPGGIHKAIKFVFGNLDSLDVDGARAEQEKKALNHIKEVRHPFVVQVDRIDIVNGELVIVMELADRSLHDAFEESLSSGLVGIPRDNLLSYVRDAAEALDHLNEVHRLQHLDVKPRNLFLVSNRVKVADFGLVKTLERSGHSGMMGAVTPLYAPPETLRGEISPHSDQYSLAIVYQELLTGHRPFNGKNVRQLAQQHMHEQPDLRALPEPERIVVARALEKDPNRRFPNCLSFVRALYTTRAPTFATILLDNEKASPGRPKSIADTLENINLEGVPAGAEDRLEPVELDIPLAQLNESNEAVSNLGVTVAQPSTGSLRPTLLIGVGGYGRRSLMELRCRLLDRFGDLEKVPLIRFLYVDTDADAIKLAQRGAPEVAFRSAEVFQLPLQSPSHYRRRQIDQLADWLPREKLYAVPRSLKTQGSRALARLAFTDTYQRLMARLKRELASACHPDAIYQTVAQTGLALRDNVPRVYVIGCGTGGASGYLPDLGYAMRRILHQSNQPDAPLVNFLFCGAPEDPATPRSELANLYATLTELHHFSSPDNTFSAQYGTDGPRLRDQGPAYDQIYLLTQPHRTAESRRDALAHMGSYLFHELTTPLGIRLDQARIRRNPFSTFRSLGTFGVWFPRGLMLRLAAREAVKRLLGEWEMGGAGLTGPEQSVVDAALARVLADPDLKPDVLTQHIDAAAADFMDVPPREALTKLLVGLEEQSIQPVAQDDPGAWARQILGRVQDWLGSGLAMPGVNVVQQRRSQLTRALEAAAASLAADWAGRLAEVVAGLMDYPGRRIAVAEAAAARLMEYCDEALRSSQARVQNQSGRSIQGQEQVQQALQNCIHGAGGWSIFGGRSRRLVRVFVDHLAAYARQCLTEDASVAVLHFYAALRGKLGDQLRDLAFCRKRLRHLQETLELSAEEIPAYDENVTDTVTFGRLSGTTSGLWSAPDQVGMSQTPLLSTETYWQTISQSETARVVLPEGESDLERSARRFLTTLTSENWNHLDQRVGDEVLAERGGLVRLCMDGHDVVRYFLSPLLNQAITCLSEHLPITDVAQVEFSAGNGLADRIRTYHAQAAPVLVGTPAPAGMGSGLRQPVLVGGGGSDLVGERRGPARKSGGDQQGFLLIPASDSGKQFGEEAKSILPEIQLVNVPGQADLMFCREQGTLRIEDLEKILHACRNAYHELSLVPPSSPHARFDINDWTPLDP